MGGRASADGEADGEADVEADVEAGDDAGEDEEDEDNPYYGDPPWQYDLAANVQVMCEHGERAMERMGYVSRFTEEPERCVSPFDPTYSEYVRICE